MAAKATKKKAKKSQWQVPPVVRRVFTFLAGPGRSFALGLLFTVILAEACLYLYRDVRDELLASSDYQVSMDDLDITPPPKWIRVDPRERAFGYLTIQGPLSIMDEDAVQRVAEAFQIHPWVKQVVCVRKYHPSRIHVELKYRQPVCMVYSVARGESRWLPVDAHGVWLPDDELDPQEARRYPKVVNIASSPVGLPGMPWRDEGVVGAAKIAAAFGPNWSELGLERIVPEVRSAKGKRAEYVYNLYTRQGQRIIWGSSPQKKPHGEPSTKDKIDRLRRYAASPGGLDAALRRRVLRLDQFNTTQTMEPVAATPNQQWQRAGGNRLMNVTGPDRRTGTEK